MNINLNIYQFGTWFYQLYYQFDAKLLKKKKKNDINYS